MAIYMRVSEKHSPIDDFPDHIMIPGDATGAGHESWIQITKVEWGGSDKVEDEKDDESEGEDDDEDEDDEKGEEGEESEEDEKKKDKQGRTKVTITRNSNLGTCGLIDWFTEGKVFSVQIDCCKEAQAPYMLFRMRTCRLVSYSATVSENKVPTETIELIFGDLKVFTATYDSKGEWTMNTPASTRAGDRLSRVPDKVIDEAEDAKASIDSPESGPAIAGAIKLRERSSDTSLVRTHRLLEIDPVDGVVFELLSFQGFECLSRPFELALAVLSEELDVDGIKLIGKEVSFRLVDGPECPDDFKVADREFHGVVREVVSGDLSPRGRVYTLHVVPNLWFLGKRTNCRIYQNKTVLEIVEGLLKEHKIRYGTKDTHPGDYKKREYCVQYRETDLAFIQRLLEEEGIFYSFRFNKRSHTMMLADSALAYRPADPEKASQERKVGISHLRKWRRRARLVSGRAAYRGYSLEAPTKSLDAEANSMADMAGIKKLELYDYPGGYDNVTDGKRQAQLRIEAEEIGHLVAAGTSTYDSFETGRSFKIEAHESEAENGEEYALIRVEHRAAQLSDGAIPRVRYYNSFRCLPKKVTYRPPHETPRPTIDGPQTAEVVGTSGEEIDVDEYGRIKVKFRWDRTDAKNENSSCWVRVSQPISGKGWGGMILPRIGQEVIVEFMEGDPDQPVVTGSLYNGENKPPYALPDNKDQTVFKTRSTKQGDAKTFNELRFKDEKEKELVYFHAEKDFERVVENDDSLKVGKEDKGNQTIHIEKDRKTTILNDDTLTIGKEDKGSQAVTIEKDHTLTVTKGNQKNEVKAGNREVLVTKGTEKRAIKGKQTVTLGSGRAVTIDKGGETLTIKLGDQTVKLNAGKSTTQAMAGIELKVGPNSIKIDSSGITLKGLTVKIEGQIQTEVKGTICTVKGTAMLEAGGGITMIG